MHLIKSIINSITKRSNEPTPQAWLRAEDIDSLDSRLVSPYTQCAWIYVAVSVLAESVAHVPFRISRGRGKGETIVDSGPLYDLFSRPHPSMSRALFWQTLVSWEALRGEFFVVPLDASGQPVSLKQRDKIKHMIPLNPEYFTHLLSGNELAGWRFNSDRGASPVSSQVLLPEEVIHWRNFNPYLFWRGLSPLTVALLPATTDFAAEQFMKGLMTNNADAGLIITTEEMLDETQRNQMLAALRDRKRRAGTADRPLFLWGKAKVEKPGISSVDLQFLENRKLNRQEIGAIFKVPESMMGFAGEKSALSAGSAIQQDRLTFIENTIGGLCRRLEAAMEPLIKSFDPMLYGWFDIDSLPVMQAARRDRMLTASKAFAMGVPFNELNQVYDLGFESLPWGNKGYLSATLREIGTSPSKSTSEPQPENPTRDLSTITDRLTQLLSNPDLATSNPSIAASAKRKSGKLSRFFFEQRGRALNQLEKLQNKPNSTIPIDASDLVNLEAETAALQAHLAPILTDDFHHAYTAATGSDLPDPTAIDTFLKSITADLKQVTQDTITQLDTAFIESCEILQNKPNSDDENTENAPTEKLQNKPESPAEIAPNYPELIKRVFHDRTHQIDSISHSLTLAAHRAAQQYAGLTA